MISLTLDEFRTVYKNYVLGEMINHVYSTSNRIAKAEWIISRYNAWFENNCELTEDENVNKQYYEKEQALLIGEFNFPKDMVETIQKHGLQFAKDYDVQVYKR